MIIILRRHVCVFWLGCPTCDESYITHHKKSSMFQSFDCDIEDFLVSISVTSIQVLYHVYQIEVIL